MEKFAQIKLGFVGGGANSLIGQMHRIAALMHERYQLVGGVFSSNFDCSLAHAMSLDINEFKTFVKKIRDAEIILGKNKKILTKGEKILKNFARKSLVAKNFIKKGEKFNKFNLTTKRPGDGKSPILWNKIIGKKATKNFKKNEKI